MVASRFATAAALLIALMAVSAPSLHAQPTASTVWGLRTGDRFTVETTIEQSTTVILKDASPVSTASSERLQIEYLLDRMLPVESRFFVRIVKSEAIGESITLPARQSLQLLEGATMQLAVDRNGHARLVAGHEGLLQVIGNQDERLLKSMYSPEALLSFLSRPFWLARSGPQPPEDDSWERIDELSAGILGSFRTVVECKTMKVSDGRALVELAGEGRHIPLASRSASATISINKITARRVTVSGEGRMWVSPQVAESSADASDTIADAMDIKTRPGFETLTITWQIDGAGTLKGDRTPRPFTFSETQTHKSRLMPGYDVGSDEPNFDFAPPQRFR